MGTVKGKLVIAVLQGNDYLDTVDELNRNGFFVTVLSSTGGFLKKRSVTVMIGVEESRTEEVLAILKRCAGRRQQTSYAGVHMSAVSAASHMPKTPVQLSVGGAVAFVLNMDDMQKF